MSLLLDALKKSGHGTQGTGLTLEEAPASAAPRAEAGQSDTARAAGQNLFAAKKKAPPRRHWLPRSSRSRWRRSCLRCKRRRPRRRVSRSLRRPCRVPGD